MRHAAAGFSLIEAVVAVGVLALGCLAAAGALHAVLGAELADGQRREAWKFLDEEAARLSALPYFRRTAGPDEGPMSLLAEVFPHARVEMNRAPGGFAGGSGAAVFVSEVPVECGVLRRTATFVRETDATSVEVSAAEVSGWAVWEAELPPALVVDLRLELVGPRCRAATRHLEVHALPSLPYTEAALSAGRTGAVVARCAVGPTRAGVRGGVS